MKKTMLVLSAMLGLVGASAAGVSQAAEIRGLGNNCLDVREGDRDNGAGIQMWRCEGNPNQQWIIERNRIVWAGSDKCLDVREGSRRNGAAVQTWTCERGNRNQDFRVERGRIVWSGNNKCLDVAEGNTSNGAGVHMWDCQAGNPNQEWRVGGQRGRNRR